MDERSYVDRLEDALRQAARRISELQTENAHLRVLAIQQCDLTLGVVTRHAGYISDLEMENEDLQSLVDSVVEGVL